MPRQEEEKMTTTTEPRTPRPYDRDAPHTEILEEILSNCLYPGEPTAPIPEDLKVVRTFLDNPKAELMLASLANSLNGSGVSYNEWHGEGRHVRRLILRCESALKKGMTRPETDAWVSEAKTRYNIVSRISEELIPIVAKQTTDEGEIYATSASAAACVYMKHSNGELPKGNLAYIVAQAVRQHML